MWRGPWSSPLVWRNSQRKELVVCGEGNVTSYNAKTGEEFWKLTGIPSSFSASPASDDDSVFFGNSGPFSSGDGYGNTFLKIGLLWQLFGKDTWKTEILYGPKGPHVTCTESLFAPRNTGIPLVIFQV